LNNRKYSGGTGFLKELRQAVSVKEGPQKLVLSANTTVMYSEKRKTIILST